MEKTRRRTDLDAARSCVAKVLSLSSLNTRYAAASAAEYRDEVAAAGQLRYLRSAIQWGADFLLRAHTSPTTLYTQVADDQSIDHDALHSR